MEKKQLSGLEVVKVLFFLAGIGACLLLFERSNSMDGFLVNQSINFDVSATVIDVVLTIFCLLISLVLYLIGRYKNIKILIPLALFFLSFGITNSIDWLVRGCTIKTNNLTEKQKKDYAIKTSAEEGYAYIGDVRGYHEVNDEREWATFMVYVKIIDYKKYYYCSFVNLYSDNNKYLVQRYDEGEYGKIRNDHGSLYVIKYDFDWEHVYVNALSQKTSQTTIEQQSQTTRTTEDNNEETQRIVVEHQRQPVPVQEWVTCTTCYGSRDCTVCGGSGWLYSSNSPNYKKDCYSCNGRKDCSACGGQGGHYETVYR